MKINNGQLQLLAEVSIYMDEETLAMCCKKSGITKQELDVFIQEKAEGKHYHFTPFSIRTY